MRAVDRVLTWVMGLGALFVAILLFAGPDLIGATKSPEEIAAEAAAAAQATPAPAAPGASVFSSAGCGSCHTFAPARSTGAIGPNLDETALDAAGVAAIVRSGSGAMPSFEGRLDGAQIEAVAEYVAGG